MKRVSFLLGSLTVSLLAVMSACSATPSSGPTPTPGSVVGDATIADGRGNADSDAGSQVTDAGSSTSCIQRQARSQGPSRRHVVVAFDRSASTDTNTAFGTRGEVFRQTLLQYAGAAQSIPTDIRVIVFGLRDASCTVSGYQPLGPSVELPDKQSVTNQLSGITGMAGASLISVPLESAYALARAARQVGTAETSAMVLITAGNPLICGDSNSKIVSTLAKAQQDGIPTLVVGPRSVAPELNSYADAGSDGRTALIDTDAGPPAAALNAALNALSVRGTCEVNVPAVFPDGSFASAARVGVRVQWGDGTRALLNRSDNCSDPNGFRFDNANSPKSVILCSGVCGTVTVRTAAYVELLLGC